MEKMVGKRSCLLSWGMGTRKER